MSTSSHNTITIHAPFWNYTSCQLCYVRRKNIFSQSHVFAQFLFWSDHLALTLY